MCPGERNSIHQGMARMRLYLFSDNEIKEIVKALKEDIPDNLRGWNIKKNFKKINALKISEICNSYCKTERKKYLMGNGVQFGTSEPLILGTAIHSIVEQIFNKVYLKSIDHNSLEFFDDLAKDELLTYLIWNGSNLQALYDLSANRIDYEERLFKTKKIMNNIINMEKERFNNRSLSSEVKILQIERFVNGMPLSMGKGKVDAILEFNNYIGIGDLKTGKPYRGNDDHKMQVTLYAILLEAELAKGVDWGALIFPFDGSGEKNLLPNPLKDIFAINVSRREDALRLLEESENLLEGAIPPKICVNCRTKDICEKEVNF